MKTWIDAFKKLGKDSSDFESTLRWLGEVITKCLQWVRDRFFPEAELPLGMEKTPLETFTCEVNSFTASYAKGELLDSRETLEIVLRLELRCGELLVLCVNRLRDRAAEIHLRGLCSRLVAIREKLEKSGLFVNSIRQKPVMLMFSGPPGVGKTVSLRMFSAAVLAQVLSPSEKGRFKKDPDSFFYCRNPAASYADGYNFQPIWFCDEYGANQTAFCDTNNGVNELLGMGSSFPNNLNMADLASKGNTYFRSKLVLLTTNLQDVCQHAQTFVREPEAIYRRFDKVFHCVPKMEYCLDGTYDPTYPKRNLWNRRLDKTKVPREWNYDVMEYYPELGPGGYSEYNVGNAMIS